MLQAGEPITPITSCFLSVPGFAHRTVIVQEVSFKFEVVIETELFILEVYNSLRLDSLCKLHRIAVLFLVCLGLLWNPIELQELILSLTVSVYVEIERLVAIEQCPLPNSDLVFLCHIYVTFVTL